MIDNYQTDFGGYKQKDGCLFFAIIKACTDIAGISISRQKCLTLDDNLNHYVKASYGGGKVPAMSDEDDITKDGAFIWDHEAVFNETLKILRSKHRVSYVARIYMPWEEARGKESFDHRYGRSTDLVIMQIRTPNTGHFRLANFDPYEPGTEMVDLKSLRYYKLRRVR